MGRVRTPLQVGTQITLKKGPAECTGKELITIPFSLQLMADYLIQLLFSRAVVSQRPSIWYFLGV